MNTPRKITLCVLIVGSYSSMTAICQSATQNNSTCVQNVAEKTPVSYDEFDSFADDMITMDIKVEEPEPTSTLNLWIQKIGTPIMMKYLALKAYMRDLCYWAVGIKNKSKKIKRGV